MVSSFCFCLFCGLKKHDSYILIRLLFSSGIWTFVFLVLESAGTSTALSIREICEKIWTSQIREIRKIFQNGPSAKLIPAKVSKFRGWSDP